MGRQEAIEKLKNELDELNEKLDSLEATGEKIGADVKSAYTEQMAALRGRKDKLAEKLGEAERAGMDLWERVAGDFEIARAALEAGITELRAQYKDQN